MTQTVIIVDDNLLCARLYKALLEPLACRVLVARTAEEAARLVGTGPADDIAGAIDVAMNRTSEEDPDDAQGERPLFLVAAPFQAEPVQQVARSAGGDALLLRKPVARDSLASLVRRHISAHH